MRFAWCWVDRNVSRSPDPIWGLGPGERRQTDPVAGRRCAGDLVGSIVLEGRTRRDAGSPDQGGPGVARTDAFIGHVVTCKGEQPLVRGRGIKRARSRGYQRARSRGYQYASSARYRSAGRPTWPIRQVVELSSGLGQEARKIGRSCKWFLTRSGPTVRCDTACGNRSATSCATGLVQPPVDYVRPTPCLIGVKARWGQNVPSCRSERAVVR